MTQFSIFGSRSGVLPFSGFQVVKSFGSAITTAGEVKSDFFQINPRQKQLIWLTSEAIATGNTVKLKSIEFYKNQSDTTPVLQQDLVDKSSGGFFSFSVLPVDTQRVVDGTITTALTGNDQDKCLCFEITQASHKLDDAINAKIVAEISGPSGAISVKFQIKLVQYSNSTL